MDPRHRLVAELRSTTDGFLRALDGVTAVDWAERPAADRWSVRETSEHVTVVLRGIHRLATTRLLSQPLPEDLAARLADDQIAHLLSDRSIRREAPAMVLPTGRWATPEQMVEMFVASRDGLAAWVEGTVEDLRRYGAPHPVLGLLDGAQWVLFAAAHTERHARQVLEIRQMLGTRR